MSTTGLKVFDGILAQDLGPDRRAAHCALCAVLHALRDRLTVDEAAYFDNQSPMLVRGLKFDGLHPAGKPHRLGSRMQRINDRLYIASNRHGNPYARSSISLCIISLGARSAAWCPSLRGISARSAISRFCDAGIRGVAHMRSQETYYPEKESPGSTRAIFSRQQGAAAAAYLARQKASNHQPKVDCS